MKTPPTPSLSARILELPCKVTSNWNTGNDTTLTALKKTYEDGHHDALSAAAALASEADETVRELYALAESWKLQNGDYPESKQHCASELIAIIARATGTDTGK